MGIEINRGEIATLISGFVNLRRIPRNLSVFRRSTDVLQIAEFAADVFNVILENSQSCKPRIRTDGFEDVITEMPSLASALPRQFFI